MTTTHQTIGNSTTSRIPLPPDATAADSWGVGADERVTRVFAGASRGTAVRVTIYGEQDHSGEVLNRIISVYPNDRHGAAELDAASARDLAADLIDAADEIDAEV
ncbi:hypothetical protein [Mycobacterium sp. URHB0021]